MASSSTFEQTRVTGAAITAQDTSGVVTVTSLVSGTACPTLQFMVSSYVIKADGSTTYEGGSCASIHAGTKLTFTGTRPTTNELLFNASQITIRTDTTPTPTPTPPAPAPVQAEVTITGASGTCPDVVFMVSTYTFKTSSSTQYSGATCADLKTGAKVNVVGTKREGDGFIVVTGVGIKRSDSTPPTTPPTSPTNPLVPTTPVSGEGVVTALVGSTSCPSLTFMISPYSIAVNASTQFEGGTCGSIKVGTKVAVTGSKMGDTTVAASKIAFRDQGTAPTAPSGPAQVVEGEGVIGSLSSGTACPALQFLISSYVIKTDGATQYVGGFCGDLKAGLKVGVKGTLNADGSVTTLRVSILAETPRPEPEAEGEGFVTGLASGTGCPALQFQISEYTITVNTSTQFTGGSCTSIAVGKKVGVKGRMTGEKTATASQITVKN